MRVGSLFSGIGALDIAVHSVLGDSRTSWFVEREGFCQEILSSRFPGVPVHGDVKEVGCENLSPIDVLVGGFPCQDLSVAGNGAGISEGTRSGLFFEMWRIAQELQPRFVLFENVPVITSRGLDIVTETIIQDGWNIEWHCLAASDVGALHRRERWWGIAHREDHLFDGYKRVGQLMDGWRVLQGSLFSAPEIIRKLPKAGMACREGLLTICGPLPPRYMPSEGIMMSPSRNTSRGAWSITKETIRASLARAWGWLSVWRPLITAG